MEEGAGLCWHEGAVVGVEEVGKGFEGAERASEVVGDHPVESLEFLVGVLELDEALLHGFLEEDHAFPDLDAGEEFVLVEWFYDVVLGAGVESLDDCLAVVLGGEEDEVGEVVGPDFPEFDADFGSGQAGHDPVQDGEVKGGAFGEEGQGVGAIRGLGDLAVGRVQEGGEHASQDGAVVGDEDTEAGGVRGEAVRFGLLRLGLLSWHGVGCLGVCPVRWWNPTGGHRAAIRRSIGTKILLLSNNPISRLGVGGFCRVEGCAGSSCVWRFRW